MNNPLSCTHCPGSTEGKGCQGLCTSRVSIFQPLSAEEQRQLVRAAGHRSVPAGMHIFNQDDMADQILIVHSGRIKLNRYSPEGKEYVLDIISAGDIYGEQRLFSGHRHEVNAIALEAVSYCEIHRRDIEALILKQPAVGIKMLQELGAKYSRVRRLSEILSINDAKGRIAGFLLHTGGGFPGRPISIARETLSASINLRPETISRKLKEMEREGLVGLEGHKIIRVIDREGLRRLFENLE